MKGKFFRTKKKQKKRSHTRKVKNNVRQMSEKISHTIGMKKFSMFSIKSIVYVQEIKRKQHIHSGGNIKITENPTLRFDQKILDC